MSYLKIEEMTFNLPRSEFAGIYGTDYIPDYGKAKDVVNEWLKNNPSVRQILEYRNVRGLGQVFIRYTKECS